MPGPWIGAADNPGFLAKRAWESGEILEAVMYDEEKRPQGKGLWHIITLGEKAHGTWLTGTLVAVEDDHLTKGPGQSQEREFFLHICSGLVANCKALDGKDRFSFHTDTGRLVDEADVRQRRAAWWLASPAKSDFEAFRRRLIDKDKVKKKSRPEGDDEDLLSMDDPSPEKVTGVAAGAEVQNLRKDLGRLKNDIEKAEQRKKRRERKERSPQEREKKRGRSADRKPKKSRSRSRRRSAAGKHRDKGTVWFGKKLPAGDGSTSDSVAAEDDRRRGSRRPRSKSSEEEVKANKKRNKKEKDRGPYGIGKALEFEKGDADGSESDSGEADFQRGASDRRSHQLRLMEYSQKRPGRLASLLLQKMRGLLSRDTGAPFTRASGTELTPATATSYLLTILIPSYKERLGVRLLRELRTIAAALDSAASGDIETTADILCQRMKALELHLNDGEWQRAQYLELIIPEGAGLAEQEEQRMAAREQALEAKMKQQIAPRQPWQGETKGKGDTKGKGRGKKGGRRGEWQDTNQETKPKASVA